MGLGKREHYGEAAPALHLPADTHHFRIPVEPAVPGRSNYVEGRDPDVLPLDMKKEFERLVNDVKTLILGVMNGAKNILRFK